jgi:hypothetical protein
VNCSVAGSERRDGYPDALLIGGHEVPGRVVSVDGRVLAGDNGGPPACRADEMADQRADIPRHTGRRRSQVVGPDLGHDGQGALQSLVQRAFTHVRSSRPRSISTQEDPTRAEKESRRAPSVTEKPALPALQTFFGLNHDITLCTA